MIHLIDRLLSETAFSPALFFPGCWPETVNVRSFFPVLRDFVSWREAERRRTSTKEVCFILVPCVQAEWEGNRIGNSP
jgi:hypothetical protein